MKKRTKIIATVGPASDSYEQIKALIYAGVNVFRLNFSHGTHEYHSEVLGRIRKAIEETGLITGILQDISGPKIRVGMLEEDFILKSGDLLEFVKEEIVGYKVKEGFYRLSISEPGILDQLQVGEHIYLYDGIIRAVVKGKSDKGVTVEIENEGMLSSRKGVNFPNTRLGIDVLTEKDRKDMLWGIENGVDFMAISFVQNRKDMSAAREIITSNGGSVQLLAKIEKFDAIENIDAILEESDGIMVARGDLGIEIPYYEVPLTQKMLIKKANNMSKPVIVATQMLLSMTTKETASRAEISDVANAVLDGADAVMLSEESAIGHNPVLAVQTMVQTIQAAEEYYPYEKFGQFEMHDRGDKIDESAVRLSKSLDCSGIIAMTASGGTAKKAARYRPSQPIYAVTHDQRTAQSLTLVWGVVPAFSVAKSDLRTMMAEVMEQGLERKVLDIDSSYILVAGDPVGVPGSTNLIRVVTRYEMEFFASLAKENKWVD
ncbi:pyruvate kinase [Sulfurovum riftiae]|uniref:Pyruvate kinase n=1 Tax=Sulfurovum riftiae TaxID=1630136 RepID=A0A151CI06_9BACT|nr:pyruvate kinase [Sulfurovum riftiae]KYJ87074.1 pyruvate kinase [Sulfurovum riftiae]